MLADSPNTLNSAGVLSLDVHPPTTFKHQLIEFVARELPRWRDRPERPPESSETILTSQLCAHLNSAARHSVGWDVLQFRVEERDEIDRSRRQDLVAAPCGATVWVDGRRHTDFDTLLPIECKRLPTPRDSKRDAREYIFSSSSSAGGVQRFKAGHHGAAHSLGAMIAFVQQDSAEIWCSRIAGWIRELEAEHPDWSDEDSLAVEQRNESSRLTILKSLHKRINGLTDIELCHLWLEFN